MAHKRPSSPSRTYVAVCRGLGDKRYARRFRIPERVLVTYPNDTQGAYQWFSGRLDSFHAVDKVVPNEHYNEAVEGKPDVDDLVTGLKEG